MNDRGLNILKRDIQKYFNFLFDRNYIIVDAVSLSMGYWMVTLQSKNNTIVIFNDQNEIDLGFAPKDFTGINFFGIKGLIYFLTKGETIIGDYKKTPRNKREVRFMELSKLVEKYHDQIAPYFGEDYEKYKLDLLEIGKDYSRYRIDSLMHK